MSRVRAFISFVSTSDRPEPWDGLLVAERGNRIESLTMVSDNRQLAKLFPDGKLLIFDGVGLKEANDMAALGRAFYRAMTGLEPPS